MTDSNKEYEVVGIGRAYIDIIDTVNYGFLDQFGIPLDTGRYFDVDMTLKIQKQLPNPVFCSGGTIPNTLAGLSAMGSRVGCFGKVAKDQGGEVFLKEMTGRGIDMLGNPYTKDTSISGTCIVLLTEKGERSFALHRGCVDQFEHEDFKGFDFSRAHYFVIASEMLANGERPDVLSQGIRKAKEQGCKVVFSLSESRIWKDREYIIHEVVAPLADIVIGNEYENEAFYKIAGNFDERLVITTLGSRGAMATHLGQQEHVSAYKGEIVSSLGAGDQFLAGFLKAQVVGRSLSESLSLAARCAAAILKRHEGRPSLEDDWRGLLSQA